MRLFPILLAVVLLGAASSARAEVCNIKVVTDASPDYTDMPSMIRSITGKWPTTAGEVLGHVVLEPLRAPADHAHGATRPGRQRSDPPVQRLRLHDVQHHRRRELRHLAQHGPEGEVLGRTLRHTVPEVFYDGRWHMYDNSMSAIYTLCDGKTIAGVEDIGKEGACAASGGKKELGHVAKYHCLTATSPNGWLTGADCAARCGTRPAASIPKGLPIATITTTGTGGTAMS